MVDSDQTGADGKEPLPAFWQRFLGGWSVGEAVARIFVASDGLLATRLARAVDL